MTPETPWRSLPKLSRARFVALLAGTPLSVTSNAIFDALGEDLATIAYLILLREQGRGLANAFATQTRNPWLMRPESKLDPRPAAIHPRDGAFLAFSSFDAAAAELRRRLTDPAYKPTDVGVYARTRTLLELNEAYSPKGDGANDPVARTAAMVTDANALFPEDEPVATYTTPVPGLSKPITTSFPVRIALMPPTQTNQRPGRPFNGGAWDFYTQHETANPAYGADVRMHEAWLRGGAKDGYGNPQELGFHLCVDDTEAAVFVPLNEIAWHAGDSGGPGNLDSVACELCVNADGDEATARRNAEELAAAVLAARGFGVDRLVQHNRWSGKDCPAIMRREGYWPTFAANVGRRLQAPSGGDYPEGMDADLAARWFGSITVDGKVYAYTEGQPLSSLWLDTGRQTGHYPQLVGVETFDARTYWTFEGGWTAWRPNANEPVRVLKD